MAERPQRSSSEVSQLVKVWVVWEEGKCAAGLEDDADQFSQIDGVDLLMTRVEAEEDGGRGVSEGVGGVVGVGEVVAGE